MKIGDRVVVFKEPTETNFVTVGSKGTLLSIDNRRTHTHFVDYSIVPGHIESKEAKEKDTFKGCYWTKPDRLRTDKINWRGELK